MPALHAAPSPLLALAVALKAQLLAAAGIQGFGQDDTALTPHGRYSACTDSIDHS